MEDSEYPAAPADGTSCRKDTDRHSGGTPAPKASVWLVLAGDDEAAVVAGFSDPVEAERFAGEYRKTTRLDVTIEECPVDVEKGHVAHTVYEVSIGAITGNLLGGTTGVFMEAPDFRGRSAHRYRGDTICGSSRLSYADAERRAREHRARLLRGE